MRLRRFAASLAVGIVALAAAIVTGIVMLYTTLIIIDVLGGRDASFGVRRGLSRLTTTLVVGPTIIVLFGLPFVAARRWRMPVIVSLIAAGVLGGLSAHEVLYQLSRINDCTFDHAFPYDISYCSGE